MARLALTVPQNESEVLLQDQYHGEMDDLAAWMMERLFMIKKR
jgi:hypothetical protein